MKKILGVIIILFYSSCTSQKIESVVTDSEITYLSLVEQQSCNDQIKIYDNQQDFNTFQSSLIQSGPRSNPLFLVDFTTKNIAVVCDSEIESYEIKNIEIRKKSNILNLQKIDNYENYGNSNTLLIEIPKKINTLELNK